MAFLTQRSPPKNHSLFTLGKNCWEERCKLLLSLLLMLDTAHLCTKNHIDPEGSEQSLVPDLFLCFAGEAHVWGCAQTTFSFLSYKQVLKWQPPSQGGTHGAFPSFGLAAQASCAQLCTIPAAESPSSFLLARTDALGLSLASSHRYREAQRRPDPVFKSTLGPTLSSAPSLQN